MTASDDPGQRARDAAPLVACPHGCPPACPSCAAALADAFGWHTSTLAELGGAPPPRLVDPAEFLAQFDDPSLRAPIYGREPGLLSRVWSRLRVRRQRGGDGSR